MSLTSEKHPRTYRHFIFRSSLFGSQESTLIAAAGPEGLEIYDGDRKLRYRDDSFGAMGRVVVGPNNVIVFTGRQQEKVQVFPDGTDFSQLDPTGIVGIPFEKDDPNKNHGPRCVRFALLDKDRGDKVTEDFAELCFETNVCGLAVNSCGYVAVVLEAKTLIYKIDDVREASKAQREEEAKKPLKRRCQTNIKPFKEIVTGLNFRGTIAMTNVNSVRCENLVAVPSPEAGKVCVVNLDKGGVRDYKCLSHQFCAGAFSPDGKWLFAISKQGKYCHIISIQEGLKVKILTRGKTESIPFPPCISDDGKFIVISSQAGTRHVYTLEETELADSLKRMQENAATTGKEGAAVTVSPAPSYGGSAGGGPADGALQGFDDSDDDSDVEYVPAQEPQPSYASANPNPAPAKKQTWGEWFTEKAKTGWEAAKRTWAGTMDYLMKNYNIALKEDVGTGTCLVCGFSSSTQIFVASSDGHLLVYDYDGTTFKFRNPF